MSFFKVLGTVAAGALAVVAAPVVLPVAVAAAGAAGAAALGAAGAAGAAAAAAGTGLAAAATGAAGLAAGAVGTTAAAVGAAGAATMGAAATATGAVGGVSTLAGAAVAAGAAGAMARRKGREEGREDGLEEGREEGDAKVALLQKKFATQIAEVSERFKEHKDFEEYTVATFAICLALANCDGEIHSAERDDIFEFVSGISQGAYPATMKRIIAGMVASPPNFSTAIELVKKLDTAHWESIDTALQLLVESDGVVHRSESAFIAAWNKSLIEKRLGLKGTHAQEDSSQDTSQTRELSANASALRDMIMAVNLGAA